MTSARALEMCQKSIDFRVLSIIGTPLYYSLIFARFCNKYVLILLFLFVHRLYVEDRQMIQLLLYATIAVGNSAFFSFN